MENKRWRKALPHCKKALALKPGDQRAKELLAEIRRNVEPAPTLTLELAPDVTMEFVYIKPGVFVMGGTEIPRDCNHGPEKPKHEVAITKGFYLGKYEVTRAQFDAVMGTNTAQGAPKLPAALGNGFQTPIRDFCRRASEKTGRKVRLPTEAEWEYACRAGSTTRWSHGNDPAKLKEYAWYGANSGRKPHPVGRKKPNAWGLYDMHGNVAEMVSDGYTGGSFRGKAASKDVSEYYASSPRENPRGPAKRPRGTTVFLFRGGNWSSHHMRCRSAFRTVAPPWGGTTVKPGLRVVVPPPPRRP
jgi:formylglycine-generating enzyme required for sulfatase activity